MKRSIIGLCFIIMICFCAIPKLEADANASEGIQNNGTAGISININSAPYTTFSNYSYGQYAYGPEGCAWFASARVNQLTGKGNIIRAGTNWWDNYAVNGFSRGSTPKAGSIICWSGHVAILEKIEGNTAYISQGGWSSAGANHGYCTITTISVSQITSLSSGFLGYVYLGSTSHNPIGHVDSASGGAGTISLAGWAVDEDASNTPIEVHVYVGGEAGSGAPGYNLGQASVNRPGLGWGDNHGFNKTVSVTPRGQKTIYVYAINIGGGNNTIIGTKTVTITEPDNEKPKISNVKVSNVSSTGYTVTCTVSDNVGVTKVLFPTWTNVDGQSDIIWGNGTISGNTATYKVNISDHNNEKGLYTTHIYAYDAADNASVFVDAGAFITSGAYTPVKTGTYKGNTYKVFVHSDNLPWNSAKEYCSRNGGHLATITSKEENDFVKSLLPSTKQFYFIGCSDRDNEGTWKWITGEKFDYKNWGNGQPDNAGDNEHYGSITTKGTWNDIYDNSGDISGFVMEIDGNVPVNTPVITSSNVIDGKNITLSCSTSGATIYYTLDGSNPTTSSTKYTAPFNVTTNTTVKAIAAASGYANSAVASEEIKVMQSVDINPNGGMINGSVDTITEVKDYGTTLDLIPTPPEGCDFAGFTSDGEGTIMPYGKPLFKDTLFENGVNGMAPYNGGDGKDVINIERVPASADCPTNSDYMVKIQSVGKTFPEYGGYSQAAKAKANGVFYHVIVAKIPKGYIIQKNESGTGEYSTWQMMGNSCYGTGEWKTYIFKTTCGTSGDFSDMGNVHISRVSRLDWHDWETIDSSQEENPMTWYVAYSNMFDATDITSNRTKDPSFTTSVNDIKYFSNSGGVTVQRKTMDDDSNKYMLEIKTDGTSSPHYGGFIQPTKSKPNGVFYHFFTAKVPKGYTLNMAYVSCGDNSKHTWITDNKGTGDWAHYIYKTECGFTGNFSSLGYVFLTKNEDAYEEGKKNWYEQATTDEPITWYVRYSDMVDMTPQYIFNGAGTLTARWSKQRCAKPTAGLADESVIFTSTPITLTSDDGADIYYTLDGTSPTTESELYTEPIYLPEGDVTLKAAAFKSGYTESYRCNYDYHVYAEKPKIYNAVSSTRSYYNILSEFENPVPSTYIIAFYDADNGFIDMMTREIDTDTNLIEMKIDKIDNAAYAKIFLWDKVKNMRPLVESEMFDLN